MTNAFVAYMKEKHLGIKPSYETDPKKIKEMREGAKDDRSPKTDQAGDSQAS